MEKKIAFFAFNGNRTCFVHALLNGYDMQKRGMQVKIVIEGAATGLLKEFNDPGKPFATLFSKVKDAGLIDGVCRACAKTMNALEDAEELGLPLLDELSGHPAMGRYTEDGFQIITV